jgi:hypothetical protein
VWRVSWIYRSQFPQKSFEHLGHRYRPVGLTPSGTGSLASGVISVSHPKQSGERVDCCRLSTVTTPYFVTGNNSQKLMPISALPLAQQQAWRLDLPSGEMGTTDDHEVTDLTVCRYVTQLASAPGTQVSPLLHQTMTSTQCLSTSCQSNRKSHDHQISSRRRTTFIPLPTPGS